jgi:DNA-binding CsgD family transcriptional regulator/tetratricopeptide (TPR) repeat protein
VTRVTPATYTATVELLEREPFLRALGEYAADAVSGNGRLVVIIGEAGIGKTALADAFRASRPELCWYWGACDGGFIPRPLGPLYDIVGSADGPVRDLMSADSDRNELFAAVLALLAENGPTGVVIEDLHWSDEATLDWLSHLSRRLSRLPVLVLVTVRDDEPNDDRLLADVMGRFASHASTRRMSLPPLSAKAVGRLAESEDARELHALTGGNPFYVGEVLAMEGHAVPPSVSDLVRARIRGHSASAQQLLAGAAVLGRPAPSSVLAALTGLPEGTVDECVASGVLVASGQDLAFRHELTRRAVEESVPPVQATELHRTALALLEHEGATSAELTHHAVGADDVEAILRHAPAAGQAAAAASAHREAVVQYRRALVHADRLTPSEHADLEEAVATSLSTRDEWAEAQAHWEQTIAIRRPLDDDVALARCLRSYGRCLWRLCDTASSRIAEEEAFALVRDADDSEERALNFYIRANSEYVAPEERQHAVAECARIGKSLGDDALVGRALMAGAFADSTETGDIDFTMLGEALEHGRRSGDATLTACAFTNFHEGLIDQLRLDECADVYAEGLAYCLDHEQHTFSVCLRGSRTLELVRRGALLEAVDLALATMTETISPVNRMHLMIGLVRAGFRLGRPEARGWLDELWELARDNDETFWLVQTATGAAEAAWITGDPGLVTEDVLATYRRGLTDDPWVQGDLMGWLVRLGHQVDVGHVLPAPYAFEVSGDHAAAAAAWHELGCPFEEGVALTATHDPAGLHRALELFTAIGAAPAAGLARRALQEQGMKVPAARGPRATTAAHPAGLTAREAEVLEVLRVGLTNAEIAKRLYLSPRTVDHHVSSILAKLGVSTRVEAAAHAAAVDAEAVAT